MKYVCFEIIDVYWTEWEPQREWLPTSLQEAVDENISVTLLEDSWILAPLYINIPHLNTSENYNSSSVGINTPLTCTRVFSEKIGCIRVNVKYPGRYNFCSLCFQPLPNGTFFPKAMLAFLSPFNEDYQKTFVFLCFFPTKSWTKPKWLTVS